MRVLALDLELSSLPASPDRWEEAIAAACREIDPTAQLLRWAIARIDAAATARVEVAFVQPDVSTSELP